jgi:D-3-phosphoglycerate dehydrogenase / 2-oxoglutarate reductase
MMKKRISLSNNISPIVGDAFPQELYEVGAGVDDPHGIIVRSADCLNMEFNPRLLGIARAGVGYNNIPVDRCTQAGICVFNTPGANANAVKELVLMSMMMASRNIPEGLKWAEGLTGTTGVEAAVEKGKSKFTGHEIRGKKLGVIGLGAIGCMVALDAANLGMDVTGLPHSPDSPWVLPRTIKRAGSLEELVATCDIVTIHVPLSSETRDLFNTGLFGKMKKGAILLNFSRAGIVNAQALKTALSDGTLIKYVTDFPDEQTVGLPNCICIPHLGASTDESEENCAIMASRQLFDYLEYGNVTNSVNLPELELPAPKGVRLTVIHKYAPEIIGLVTSALVQDNVEIEEMFSKSRKDIAYTVIDTGNCLSENQIKRLRNMEGIIRFRMIGFPNE